MASACVNNLGMSPENFPPKTYQSYGWLSPRISFSREEDSNNTTTTTKSSSSAPLQSLDPLESLDSGDFEFRLDKSITMLPADELFSEGKLMPLQVNTCNIRPSLSSSTSTLTEGIRSPEPGREPVKCCRRLEMAISGADPCLFSPKAPRCSSRWKELLGLKKLHQNPKPEKSTSALLFSSSSSSNSKSLKHFLHRNSKTCSCNTPSSNSSFSYTILDHSLSLPLLRDLDRESLSISSRLSLSSSSSSHEHEDLPRLSLDSDKPSTGLNTMQNPGPNPFILNRNPNQNPPRMRMVKPRSENGNSNNGTSSTRVGRSPMRRSVGESSEVSISRGVSVDSPRMNSSGKIVFQSLERSSSSPSSFNGGPRYKQRGMERSYSANVRVAPVLNVPVCSLRGSSKSGSVFGFGQLFSSSPQKRDGINKGYQQQQNIKSSSGRNRSDKA
ncbi:PREDICTED: uncharacterized protein LOC105138824 [Populus euphratica]|uniref:Uncharacterized protein LOC105138824 n=1 Tax=Populus euphratica TaxID=75702 RepID=A0AAJ6Y5Z4_POPEU|nr:PREDICTED: uncharacterized protein LOC105138824 [Populus euphratica]